MLDKTGLRSGIALCDELVHGMDLATATGQDATMPEDLAEAAFATIDGRLYGRTTWRVVRRQRSTWPTTPPRRTVCSVYRRQPYGPVSRLDALDLSHRLSHEEEAEQLENVQRRLLHLRLVLGGLVGDGGLGPPVLVLFEGWDASGKGGAIKRLVGRLDPRHVRVAQFVAPTADEKRQSSSVTLLEAFGRGGVGWRCSIARGTAECSSNVSTASCAHEEWDRAYDEITQFERSLGLEGVVVIKLWMHISVGSNSNASRAVATTR